MASMFQPPQEVRHERYRRVKNSRFEPRSNEDQFPLRFRDEPQIHSRRGPEVSFRSEREDNWGYRQKERGYNFPSRPAQRQSYGQAGRGQRGYHNQNSRDRDDYDRRRNGLPESPPPRPRYREEGNFQRQAPPEPPRQHARYRDNEDYPRRRVQFERPPREMDQRPLQREWVPDYDPLPQRQLTGIPTPQDRPQWQPRPAALWSSDGQPKCHICSKKGHLARSCPLNQPAPGNRQPRVNHVTLENREDAFDPLWSWEEDTVNPVTAHASIHEQAPLSRLEQQLPPTPLEHFQNAPTGDEINSNLQVLVAPVSRPQTEDRMTEFWDKITLFELPEGAGGDVEDDLNLTLSDFEDICEDETPPYPRAQSDKVPPQVPLSAEVEAGNGSDKHNRFEHAATSVHGSIEQAIKEPVLLQKELVALQEAEATSVTPTYLPSGSSPAPDESQDTEIPRTACTPSAELLGAADEHVSPPPDSHPPDEDSESTTHIQQREEEAAVDIPASAPSEIGPVSQTSRYRNHPNCAHIEHRATRNSRRTC